VINALSDLTHPCQGLADLLTIKEKKGDFKGLKVVYAGDIWNVCHSLMIAAGTMGFDMYVAIPEGYAANPKVYQFATEAAKRNGTKMVLTQNLKEALKDADVVYANTCIAWVLQKKRRKNGSETSAPIRSTKRWWRWPALISSSCIACRVTGVRR